MTDTQAAADPEKKAGIELSEDETEEETETQEDKNNELWLAAKENNIEGLKVALEKGGQP